MTRFCVTVSLSKRSTYLTALMSTLVSRHTSNSSCHRFAPETEIQQNWIILSRSSHTTSCQCHLCVPHVIRSLHNVHEVDARTRRTLSSLCQGEWTVGTAGVQGRELLEPTESSKVWLRAGRGKQPSFRFLFSTEKWNSQFFRTDTTGEYQLISHSCIWQFEDERELMRMNVSSLVSRQGSSTKASTILGSAM